jgi:hypothetical protein
MWFWGLLTAIVAVVIFLGTINMTPGKIKNEDLWVKVKIKVGTSETSAGWCRVIPGQCVKFYTLEGSLIDHKKNKVKVIERLDSSIDHPIPLLDSYETRDS